MSKPETVEAYLASQPPDRRDALQAVRKVILKNLDRGFEEGIQYGMIGYYVPHTIFPAGYHCDPKQPLPFAALGSQKNHMALHLMCVYGSPENERAFKEAWARSGKKLDMGKACVRFKKLEDVALEAIGAFIKSVPAKRYIAEYQGRLATGRPEARGKPAKKPEAKAKAKPAKKPEPKAKPAKKPQPKSRPAKKPASRAR